MFENLLLEKMTRDRLSWYVRESADRSNSLILLGEKGIGKYQIAKQVASWLLGLPPGMPHSYSLDYFEVGEQREGTIKEQTEAMLEFISFAPVKAPKRVVLVDNAESMNQNFLLKPMESQTDLCVFILVAHSNLLPTVNSRGVLLPVVTPTNESLSHYLGKYGEQFDPVLVAASGGKIGYYRRYQEREPYKRQLHSFLERFNRMDSPRELLESCGALREKDPAYLFLVFDKEEQAGFLGLLKCMFRWNLSYLGGACQEPPIKLRPDMHVWYPMTKTVRILDLIKQQEQMLKAKGRYSKNDFFDLLMSLVG